MGRSLTRDEIADLHEWVRDTKSQGCTIDNLLTTLDTAQDKALEDAARHAEGYEGQPSPHSIAAGIRALKRKP